MKKYILLLMILPLFAIGQDMVILKSGPKVYCRITQIVDSVVYYQRDVNGTLYKAQEHLSNIQELVYGYDPSVKPMVYEHPKVYMRRATNQLVASILISGATAGSTFLFDAKAAPYIAAGGGLLSLIFYISGVVNISTANESLQHLEVNGTGVTYKF